MRGVCIVCGMGRHIKRSRAGVAVEKAKRRVARHKESDAVMKIRKRFKRVERAERKMNAVESVDTRLKERLESLVEHGPIVNTAHVLFVHDTTGREGEFGYYENYVLDDQWLTRAELIRMADEIEVRAESDGRYLCWQSLRVEWDASREHYYLRIDVYGPSV